MRPSSGRRRAVVIGLAVLLAFLAGAATTSFLLRRGGSGADPGLGAPAAAYHCPMHPSMVSDKPGECPICGMRMVRADGREEPAPAGASSPSASPGRRVVYRSTMNPGEVSDHPGKDSMGMDMEAIEIDPEPGGATRVEGRAPVRIAPARQQLIGVRTQAAARVPFVRSIRSAGQVVPDETRLHHVHTKIEGYVDTLRVNATGDTVRRGDPLLTIYSPELVATQEEYLVALRARDAARRQSLPEITRKAEDLLESARRRLLLYDLRPSQIDELERTGVSSLKVTLYAPISGYVTQRNVTQGERIDPSMTLLDIADLSRVWVIASVYEYELPFVHVGQKATVTLSYLPGRSWEGRIGLIYPTLEGATRTARVRIEFANPDLDLKPEMFAEVSLQSELGVRLAVPDSAVLVSGTRNILFVARGDGSFEPREVRLGLRLPDSVEILEGVSEGETVVTSGNFLVDSESRLKAALESSTAPRPAPAPGDPR